MIGVERIAMAGTLAVMTGVLWLIHEPAAALMSAVTVAFIAAWTIEEWP